MEADKAQQFLEEIWDRVVECDTCGGSGLNPDDPLSACVDCGGMGERWDGYWIDTGLLREALELGEHKPKGDK